MKLREAKVLKNKLSSTIIELNSNRTKNSVVELTPGENPMEYIAEKPEEVTKQIEKIHAEVLKLNELFRNACNQEINVPELNGKFSIAVLLDRVKFVRQELGYFKSYASRLPKQRNRMLNNDLVSVVTYSIEDYKLKAKALENEALLLSNIIDELDNQVEIDYSLPEGLI
jgi:hypothetical protein